MVNSEEWVKIQGRVEQDIGKEGENTRWVNNKEDINPIYLRLKYRREIYPTNYPSDYRCAFGHDRPSLLNYSNKVTDDALKLFISTGIVPWNLYKELKFTIFSIPNNLFHVAC